MRLTYDVGPQAGMGHMRRMQALAKALRARNVETIVGPLDDSVIADDVVFVDSYYVRADDTAKVRGRWIGAIDDLDRDLAVDLIVEPGGIQERPTRATDRLFGLPYALLDPSISELRVDHAPTDDDAILVTAGASVMSRSAFELAESIAARVPAARVRLVVAPGRAGTMPAGVEVVRSDDGLERELARSGLIVTAAGVTMLEALALGRPVVAIVSVDNQQPYADAVSRHDAALVVDLADAPDTVARLFTDPELRRALSARAVDLVDGRGAMRVADAIVASAFIG